MALQLTDTNFQQEVLDSDKLAVIDFWAVWCGPCKMIAPIIDEIANEYGEKVVVGKVDVDNNPAISSQYGIRSIPTIFFIKNGEVVDRVVGAVPKSELVKRIQKHA